MPVSIVSRRQFAAAVCCILPTTVVTGRTKAAADTPAGPAAAGLSHTAAAIRGEMTFATSSANVYKALTDTAQFDALTKLSDAASLLTAPGAKATSISAHVGGAFTLFGGYVTGRQLELLAGKRLVQAWRAKSWPPGAFSIVRFALEPDSQGCRMIFDHRGFPDDQGEALAYGWRVHYWEPLAKLLRQG